MSKKYLTVSINDKIISSECENANTVVTRFLGLMFRKSMPEGHSLLLEPCNQIHTFNMRFDIDVVTLDKGNRVLAVFDSVPSGKCKKAIKGGRKVLELNAGEAKKFDIKCGDTLIITASE